GRIKSLTRPDGKVTTFDHDRHGEVNKIKFGDGYTYKEENGVWNEYDDHGQKTGPVEGKFSVSTDIETKGEITFVANDGSLKSVKHRDASTTVSRNDETVVELDPDARVTSITYKNGASNSVYYEDGKPCKIVNSDGTTWVKEADGWNAYKGDKK